MPPVVAKYSNALGEQAHALAVRWQAELAHKDGSFSDADMQGWPSPVSLYISGGGVINVRAAITGHPR
jgi:hypothetical protein